MIMKVNSRRQDNDDKIMMIVTISSLSFPLMSPIKVADADDFNIVVDDKVDEFKMTKNFHDW